MTMNIRESAHVPLATNPVARLTAVDDIQADNECKCGRAHLSVDAGIMSSYDSAPCACGDAHKRGGKVEESIASAPDGGYGWVVVFAAFMSNFIVDGICNSFGTFMAVYQQHFGQSKAIISLIGSLLIGCYLLIGPVAGGLVNKYGVRPVVIAGSLLAAISFAASIFSPNAYVFMLSYGVLGGAGLGLVYLPSIVCVSFYFDSKRSMATGITVAGSGAGTFALPPLCVYFIKAFGWRMAVCLLATIALSGVALGGLFKPLPQERSKEKVMSESPKSTNQEVCQHLLTSSCFNMNNVCMHEKRNVSAMSFANEETESNGPVDALSCGHPNESRQPQYFYPRIHMSRSYESGMTFNRNTIEFNGDAIRRYAHSMDFLPQYSRSFAETHSPIPLSKRVEGVETTKPLSRRAALYHGFVHSLHEFEERGKGKCPYCGLQRSVQMPKNFREDYISCNAPSEYYESNKYERIGASVRNKMNEIVDVELVKEPVMMVMCVSNVLAMLGFYVPFMFILDMAAEKGIATEDASLLLSMIGITNTLGRVVSGWVADRQWVSALTTHNMSLIICGLLTCFCPLLPYYNPLLGYAVLFGFVISAYICLTSIVLTDLLGLDRLTNSFGLVVVSRGIASLLGTPIAGAVYDITSSYNASFYFAGILMALAGIVPCTIPYLHRQHQDERDGDNEAKEKFILRATSL